MSNNKFILDMLNAGKKKKKQPTKKIVTIAGQQVEVEVYPEGGKREKSYMRMRGKQTHDAKITAHMSLADINK